jgi:hypothetical protein
MRVNIQRRGDGLYYHKAGKWTPSASKAHDFGNTFKAITFCMERDMSKVMVVLKHPDPRCDIFLPAHEIPPFFMPFPLNASARLS